FTAFALIMCFAGCGGQSGTSDGEAVTAAHSTEELSEELSKYMTETGSYSVEGAEAIDVLSIMKGKKIFILPGNYTVKFSQTTCDNIKSICDSIGVDAYIFATDGTSAKWVEGIETAINQKYDIILAFSGVTMEEISPQVDAAEAAGIPVVDVHFHDFEDADGCSATYCLPAGYEEFGRALALYAINSAGVDGDYLFLTSDDLMASKAMEKGINSAFEDYAPNAKTSKISVVCPDWSTKVQTEIQNALVADPNIDYIIACFDSTLLYVTAGIEGAGKTGEVKCNGYNGTPDVLDLVNKGSVDADLGECLELMAYCSLDQIFRILNGDEPLEDENPSMYFWDSANIENALDSSGTAGFGGYDDSYIEYYRKLWMLS
ncbi:MAG: sugar ABC transporter substrate-binding protein, partial [Firmicutes bacterium]|nr:sugar ABC transporter substrate-binding protein [Bacillota bacterium]